MASSVGSERDRLIPEALADPVDSEFMDDAVTLFPCGHVVREKTALDLRRRGMPCPLDRKVIESFVVNHEIRGAIAEMRAAPRDYGSMSAPSAPPKGSSPQRAAAAAGVVFHVDLKEAFLEACQNGDADRISSLVEAGADPNARFKMGQKETKTPLYIVVEAGHIEAAERLIALGAKVDVKSSPSVTFSSNVGASSLDVHYIVENRTPLHAACKKRDLSLMRLLLDNSADIEAVDGLFFTPLLTACQAGTFEAVELLVGYGANVDKAGTCTNRFRNAWSTPLIVVASRGKIDMLNLLLANDAKINEKNIDGAQTALDAAIEGGHEACAERLREVGAARNHEPVAFVRAKTNDPDCCCVTM